MPRPVRDATINQRVTAGMKSALARFAKKEHTTEGEIVRQALVKFLKGIGFTDEELDANSPTDSLPPEMLEAILKEGVTAVSPLPGAVKPKTPKGKRGRVSARRSKP